MPNNKQAKELGSWVKLGGALMALAVGGTSLGFCSKGWVTPAEAAVVHGALDDKIEALDEKFQRQTIERFDRILERLPE